MSLKHKWIDLRFLAWDHLGFVVAVWLGFSGCRWLVVVDNCSWRIWYLDGFLCLVTRKVEEKKRKWIRDYFVLDVFVWSVGKKVKEKKISCWFFYFFDLIKELILFCFCVFLIFIYFLGKVAFFFLFIIIF